MIKTVLFDLDGTLLPMDLDEFCQYYFKDLFREGSALGLDPAELKKGLFLGIEAMRTNNGSQTNENAFWSAFASAFQEDVLKHKDMFDAYYLSGFNELKKICGFQPLAAQTVERLKGEGFRVAVATNPLFPQIAQRNRLIWAGLDPEAFELITSYEQYCYAKPNAGYYLQILEQMGVKPEETLMVGNDISDDMPAARVGMQVFLLTDWLINNQNEDISKYPHGDYAALWQFIEENK